MVSEKESPFEVSEFYRKTRDILKLKPGLGKIGFSRKAAQSSLQKDRSPVQIWSAKDIDDMERLSPGERAQLFSKRLKAKTFCLILADGATFSSEIKEEIKKRRLALFYSELSQNICRERMKNFFLSLSPSQIITSGELLHISGLGILIVGESGIGKSEIALELVSRGYHFISDDVVHVKKGTDGKLVGSAPSLTRNFMEIRGLGIINIKEIFGAESIKRQIEINLVIRLKKMRRLKEYDRLGLTFPEDYEILGKKIPQINIPVAPGRNIATLIEVACKAHILKEKGYHAPLDIVRKLDRALSIR